MDYLERTLVEHEIAWQILTELGSDVYAQLLELIEQADQILEQDSDKMEQVDQLDDRFPLDNCDKFIEYLCEYNFIVQYPPLDHLLEQIDK